MAETCGFGRIGLSETLPTRGGFCFFQGALPLGTPPKTFLKKGFWISQNFELPKPKASAEQANELTLPHVGRVIFSEKPCQKRSFWPIKVFEVKELFSKSSLRGAGQSPA